MSFSRWCRCLLPVGILLGWSTASTLAAPFAKTVTFTQPDGTVISLWGEGDEFYAVFETTDGYTVVFNPATRAYHYAQLSADGSTLEPSPGVVGRDNPANLRLAKKLRMSEESRQKQVLERSRSWNREMGISQRWQARKAALRPTGGPTILSPPDFTTVGTKVGLCLLIDFPDDEATVTASNINEFCNGYNFSRDGNNGSVRQYFSDVSGGLLNYSNVVTAYVRMHQSKTNYNRMGSDAGSNGRKLIFDAIAILTNQVDYASVIWPAFSNLTVDSYGDVVAFNVLFAGDNGGVWSKGLWPHSSALDVSLSLGEGKTLYRYQITDIQYAPHLGTFCHENGHMLCGYPDLYDYGKDSYGGAGTFCLMGLGAHSGNPVQPCAYLKRASGWGTTVDFASGDAFIAAAANWGTNFNRFYRYVKPGVSSEYYLLEARHASGRDAQLPSSGLAIWHVDELGERDNQSTNYNTDHVNFEASLMQADNLWHFQRLINDGDYDDLFFAGNSTYTYINKFNDTTQPCAKWWNGSDSGLRIYGISAPGTQMTWRVGWETATPILQSVVITTEDCSPGNGAVDPGEQVTMSMTIRNIGGTLITNLVGTLLARNGVAYPRGAQTFGALDMGAAATRSFSFTATGTCGEEIHPVIQLQDGESNIGNLSTSLTLGAVSIQNIALTNPAVLTIPDMSPALAYPSTLIASGLPTNLTSLTVTLTDMTHLYPRDLDILLVSPAGQKVVLMSGAGYYGALDATTVTFDDKADQDIPYWPGITNRAYRPANYLLTNNASMPGPAPAAPYSTVLGVFSNQDPNGTWSLYVNDTDSSGSGTIGGWRLNLTFREVTCCEGSPVAPSADFATAPVCGYAPLEVTFTNLSIGTLTGSSWTFGDDANSNTLDVAVRHTYETAGTFTVSLAASGPLGTDTVTKTDYITVSNPPPAVLVVSSAALGFGEVQTGLIAQASLVVSNAGGARMTGTLMVDGGPFSLPGGEALSLGWGGSTNVIVYFSPVAPGLFSNHVRVVTAVGSATNALVGVGVTNKPVGLVAYEGFDSAPGTGALANASGASSVGWTNRWSTTVTNDVLATGLAYRTNGLTLRTAEGAAELKYSNGGGSYRGYRPPFTTGNGSVWISFLARMALDTPRSCGLSLYTTNEMMFIGDLGPGSTWAVTAYASTNKSASSTIPVTSQVFMVVRIDFNVNGDMDNTRFWINPELGTAPPSDNAATMTILDRYLNGGTATNFTRIRLQQGTNINNGVFDEIRIGTNWNAVAPYGGFYDTNGNGAADDWEWRHFRNFTQVTPTSDFDGDGALDREEFVAGTNPTNHLDFQALYLDTVPGSNIWMLRFPTTIGRLYRVDVSTNLLPPDWIALFSNLTGTGTSMDLMDTNTSSPRFYRQSIELPP